MKHLSNHIVLLHLLFFPLICCTPKGGGESDLAPGGSPVQGEEAQLAAEAHDHQHGAADDPHRHSQTSAAESLHQHGEGMISVEGEWERLVGLETAFAREMPLELLISVPGQIIPDQNRVAVISPFIESSINCVFVNLGDRVAEGDLLACVTSPEIGILRAEYDRAKAEHEIELQNFERRRILFADNIISEKAYQEAELALKLTEVSHAYARKKLLAMGIGENELDNPPSGHSEAVGSTLHIHAPISGILTSRNASIGQKVDLSTRLFEILDIGRVWLEADVFEKDIAKIRLGQTAKVRVSAYADVFTGKIFFIGSTLNPDTKTIKVLVEIVNAAEKLKPGMFATTAIVIGEKESALTVPLAGVLEDENLHIVFVKEGEGYHRHIVELGIRSDRQVEITSGLRPGDEIVTTGNFQLMSRLKMAGVDPHAGHVH